MVKGESNAEHGKAKIESGENVAFRPDRSINTLFRSYSVIITTMTSAATSTSGTFIFESF